MTQVRVLEGRCENDHVLDWIEGERFVNEKQALPVVVSADVVRLVTELGYCTDCGTKVRLATEPTIGEGT